MMTMVISAMRYAAALALDSPRDREAAVYLPRQGAIMGLPARWPRAATSQLDYFCAPACQINEPLHIRARRWPA